jgi:hypothetical protein
MTRIFICLSVVMTIATSAVCAQDPAPPTPPQPEVTTPPERLPRVDPSQLPPEWTYERQIQNPSGTVTNTHRYLDVPEDGRYVRQHIVTNPRGEMTQTWERVNTEEGYEYRRSQTWSPDEPIAGQMTNMPKPVHSTAVSPPMAPAASPPTEKVSWWQKLNPLRNKGNQTAGSATASAPRRGFTIGTPNSNSVRASSLSSNERPIVGGSQNTHRPAWTGGPSRSMRPQGPSAQANGHATASRPNPGRGPHR